MIILIPLKGPGGTPGDGTRKWSYLKTLPTILDDSGTNMHYFSSLIDLAWFQGRFPNRKSRKCRFSPGESPWGGDPWGIPWGTPSGDTPGDSVGNTQGDTPGDTLGDTPGDTLGDTPWDTPGDP